MKTIPLVSLLALALAGCSSVSRRDDETDRMLREAEERGRLEGAQIVAAFEQADRMRSAAREAYVAEHPSLPDEMKSAIRSGGFVAGMSAEDTLAAMGRPQRRIEAGGVGGVSTETWFYPGATLSFVGGKIATWVIRR